MRETGVETTKGQDEGQAERKRKMQRDRQRGRQAEKRERKIHRGNEAALRAHLYRSDIGPISAGYMLISAGYRKQI